MRNQAITFNLLIWICCSLLAISEWFGIYNFPDQFYTQKTSSESIPHALMKTLFKLSTFTPGHLHITALQCQLESCTLTGQLKSIQTFSRIQTHLKKTYQCHITSGHQNQGPPLTCQKPLTQPS